MIAPYEIGNLGGKAAITPLGALAVRQRLRDWLAQATNAVRSGYGRTAGYLTLGNFVSLSWISIWVVICLLIFQDLSRDFVMIEPIATPRAFADDGYTPEVASYRLRDALNAYADNSGTTLQLRAVESRAELPDFVVPQIGISFNSVVASIRSALSYGRHPGITGEFVLREKLLLRVRIDGREVFSGSGDADDPDELLARAAPAVMEKIWPYSVIATLYKTDPKRAIAKADSIIAHSRPSEAAVQWAYMLKGFDLTLHRNFAEAEAALRTAVRLNWSNASAHAALGNALREQGRFDEAIAQYRRAIAIDRNFARAHSELGQALRKQSKPDDAIAEYREAIRVDPNYALSHVFLAQLLFRRGEFDDAMAEYKTGIEYARVAPELTFAHSALADDLAIMPAGDIGDNREDAVTHYRIALRNDPNNVAAYNNMGQILATQLKFEEATSAFREGLLRDPDNATIQKSLADTLRLEEQIAQLREAASQR